MKIFIPFVTALVLTVLVAVCFSRIDELKLKRCKPLIMYVAVFILNVSTAIIIFSKYPYAIYFYSLMLLINLLLVIAIIDYKTKSIPYLLLLPMLAAGAATIFFIPDISFYNPLISALVIGLIMFLISKKSNEALGMGDVKLISCLALFFGYPNIVTIIFLSLLLGLFYGLFIMVKNKQSIKTEIPFIPFVFLSTLVKVLI